MARPDDEVEALLQEYADLLSITGGDAFKVRSYEKAARAVGGHHEDVSTLDVAALRAIPGVGKSIDEKVAECFRTGTVSAVEEARAKIPAGVRQLTTIPTLGPKTEENILHGVALMQQAGDRALLDVALELADEIVAELSRVAFRELSFVSEVIASGETKTSIRTTKGLQVDLRVVPLSAWGAALQYFTGSKAHNIRTREIAVHAGLKLSESESETEADLRGDLHTHTDLTDGVASLEDMVRIAAGRGLSYYAVTDHAPDMPMQRMTDEKMLAQRGRVAGLDGKHRRMRVLHGTELNIGPDGSVDWPGEFLRGFDVCVASVHSHFTQDRDTMTRRLVRAIENPCVDIIGHPTARLIGRRPAIDVDQDILLAKRYGVKFAIDSDAHSPAHLAFPRYGVGTAQRGWLTTDDVINTWPWRRLKAFLHKR